MKKQIISLLIAVIILTSCTSTPPKSGNTITQPDTPAIAMGRYIEKDISPNINKSSIFRDGSIKATTDDKIVLYVRGDTCYTFINENGQWNDEYIKDAALLKPICQKYLGIDTSWYATKEGENPQISKRISTNIEIVDANGYIFNTGEYLYRKYDVYTQKQLELEKEYFSASFNGTDARYYIIPQIMPSSEKQENNEIMYTKYTRISSQNVLILYNQKELIFYDLSVDDGKKIGTMVNPSNKAVDNKVIFENGYTPLAIIDDTVLYANEENATLYSLATGDELASVDIPNITKVTEGVDGTFYAINKDGIWRILPQGGIVQRVIDSSVCAFSAPSFSVLDFTQDKAGNFYVLGNTNNTARVYKYEFDVSAPLERETTLHLWALRDNPTMREAAAQFMRDNPEVKIYIEVMPLDTKVDVATDSLISTLKAGTGPDIIITDGINLTKLQNMLEPISSKVDLSAYDTRFLPHGQVKGEQIALPTRAFITGKGVRSLDKTKENFRLDNYLDTLKIEPSAQQLLNKYGDDATINIAIQFSSRDTMYNIMYQAACATIWQDGFNKDAAALYLQTIKECDRFIYDPYQYALSYVPTFKNYSSIVIGDAMTSEPVGLYGEINAIAGRIVSVSATSQYKELCHSFINTMLSDTVQKSLISDGMATTKYSLFNGMTEKTTSLFALDGLYNKESEQDIRPPVNLNIFTANYIRDDAFKAIAFDYLDGKFDLDKALESASKILF